MNGTENAKGARRGLSLAGRINLIVSAALVAGLGLAATVFVFGMASTRASLSGMALQREADILYSSIENFMLVGEAPVAVKFFRDLAGLESGFRVGLYRRDGQGAFGDNSTITTVNANLMRERFAPRMTSAVPVAAPERPYFDDSVTMPFRTTLFRLEEDGRTFDRIYRPLLNLPRCAQCHGSDHTVRGVIDLRFDVTSLLDAQAATVTGTSVGFLVLVSALAFIIGRFMRRVVVNPVAAIARVCAAVTSGDFSGTVQSTGDDEVGRLGSTVNQMVHGLYERYELTKYVSAGTISSISGGQGPQRVERTLLFTDVRGFTSYTETHGAEAIVSVLNLMLDEQARVIKAHGGDIDKFVGDEVVAVFAGDDAPARACLAAAEIKALVAARSADFGGLAVGTGIATGMVILGMVGSHVRADFTVIGDPVNVAARLCSIARRGQVLVCDCSYDRLAARGDCTLVPGIPAYAVGEGGEPGAAEAALASGSGFAFSGPYKAKLKGKHAAQRVYLLLGVPAGGNAAGEGASHA